MQHPESTGSPQKTPASTHFVVPPEYPSDFEPVIIHLPALRDASIKVRMEVGQELVRAFELWAARLGVDLANLPQIERARLRQLIGLALDDETLTTLTSDQSAGRREEALRSVVARIEDTVRSICVIPRSRRGAKLKNTVRDQRMYELRQEGLSFGQIEREMSAPPRRVQVKRQAVEAACRREKKRRDEFADETRSLIELLRLIGIFVVEDLVESASSSSSNSLTRNSAGI
ncbi:MAG TPA: hypothetical protein VII23_14020 [Terriglobales bacterium]